MLVGQRPMKSLSSVCLSVCPSDRPSLTFLRIGSLVFSDKVHDYSWPWCLVTDKARFLKPKFDGYCTELQLGTMSTTTKMWPNLSPNSLKSWPKWSFLFLCCRASSQTCLLFSIRFNIFKSSNMFDNKKVSFVFNNRAKVIHVKSPVIYPRWNSPED